MESHKLHGVFHKRLPDMTFSSGNKKAEFVLELITNGKDGKEFREFPKFEVVEKFMAILSNVGVGDEVIVTFTVSGRKWNKTETETQYFTILKAWEITVTKKASGDMVAYNVNSEMSLSANHDDLPF